MGEQESRARIDEIREAAAEGDHERAHGRLDALYRDALLAIAAGRTDAVWIAQEVTRAESIAFHRYCA